MLQNIIRLINRLMFFLNAIVLTLMLIWSLLGIWEFVPQDDLYWKVFITLVAILLFNVLTIFCLSFLYRKTLKMIDIFNESEYATLHEEGETIFEEGQDGKIMYLITKGKVELLRNRTRLEVVGPGEIFGEMAIVDDLPRSASAVCLEDCKLISINEKRFYELLHEVPFFAREVMKNMSHRLRNYNG
ncbi:MAG: cyclic nucleotide-binding domain-containing protein [Methylococcales bacterium]